jgi:hypothetical protein
MGHRDSGLVGGGGCVDAPPDAGEGGTIAPIGEGATARVRRRATTAAPKYQLSGVPLAVASCAVGEGRIQAATSISRLVSGAPAAMATALAVANPR